MTQRAVSYQVYGNPPDTEVFIIDSTGDSISSRDPDDLLAFLRYRQSGVFRIFWDLDESIAPVLKLLPVPVLESLARFDEDTRQGEHQLYYLPDRSLRIGRARFYGIKGFWPTDYPEPESMDELQDRADDLLETLSRCGMHDPIKLTSPIAVFEGTELGRKTYDTIPKGYELPSSIWGVLEYAYQADRREWITAYQVGHWKEGKIWDYDISSAYPFCASRLYDLRDMELWKSDSFGSREQGAFYGILKGHLYLDPKAEHQHTSPIMTDLDRMPGNPAGDFGDDYYLTLDEFRYISRADLGEFRFKDGWFARPLNGVRPRHPFQDIMSYLYEKRVISPLASSIMKGIANQLIGKLIETKVTGEYGDLRNDFYHALILAQTRCRVADFLLQNEVRKDELVVVQTDGCRIAWNRPDDQSYSNNITIRPNSGMGEWRCNGSQPTIVASPYKVYCGDKKPGHLTYDMVTDMVDRHPMSQHCGRTVDHRTTMKQALQQGDIGRVGELVKLPAHIDMVTLEREQNRVYSKLPKTGRALLENTYQSGPVEV